MRGDLPAAALNLLCALPVRTHERTFVRHVQGSKAPPKIIVNGKIYASVVAAARGLRRSRGYVRQRLKDGRYSYA